MSVTKGRFSPSDIAMGLIKDIVDNDNIEDCVAICRFKDGSIDVYGSMNNRDLAFGVKVIDSEYLHYNIQEQSG